ncbi:MAG: PolC-type DNA polymerase III [Oscillospiraceae bacterium]|nr:PolC-type DNA polymerase III [Oscillospiraceae bacterium]
MQRYCPEQTLEAVGKALCELYGFHSARILPQFSEEMLCVCEPSDLNRILINAYSPAAASLAGCEWVLGEEESRLHLRANGKEGIEPYLPLVERFLADRFGVTTKITVVCGSEVEGDGLFAQTELMRRQAMQNIPQPNFGTTEKKKEDGGAIYGKPIKGKTCPISEISLERQSERVIIEGRVFAVEHRDVNKGAATVVAFDMTDFTGSVRVSDYFKGDTGKPITDAIKKPGLWVRVQGKIDFDNYAKEVVIRPVAIMKIDAPKREDTAEHKRVELHLHTTMSLMDALTKTEEAVATAARWGHRAIAITDHGVVSAFPTALHALTPKGKAPLDIKILYGCEGYYVNDVDDRIAVHGGKNMPLLGEFVAFDLETTGLSSVHDAITEIGAVLIRDGETVETFCTFVDPKRKLDPKTIELTGITDEMLRGAPEIADALPDFLKFCGDRPLVAHNADFDVGFLKAACERLHIAFAPTYIDTLILAQNLLPHLSKHKLNIVADALSLPEFNHHRASDDALTCGLIYLRLAKAMAENGVQDIQSVNAEMEKLRAGSRIADRRTRHIIVFAKNQLGLRNLYHIVSDAHLKFFRRNPRMPKSELLRYREGLIIGSACEAGELFQAVVAHKSMDELKRIASFYDFLEIQPLSNNKFMLEDGTAESEEELREFNRTIVRLGEELGKPVCATGDVHFLEPEDEIYRRILLASKDYKDCDRPNPLYFRTTDEMLEEFSYLGAEKAFEVVVTNPNLIADMCDTIRPVPHNLFAPKIENSVEDLKSLVYGKLRRLYGERPPEIITKRVETELNDIITCHYDVIYMSAQKLVQNSLDNGYLVGSRGSVGSSLVAFLSGITEVNSLPPHYRCPKCKYCTFDVPDGINCGADLPDEVCPECGTKLDKDGFNIPFETFLGFGGDKVPDIDLNFSGEYQSRAHQYCVSMFGASHVFRAGTIGTVAEKTAFGYVKHYLDERNLTVSRAEENRLAAGCVDVRRTTGQHPGGLVVIPQENEIWDFCPVQHPADDIHTDIITTHFEYHSMEENLLKLDMLGHDDPTMIRMMEDLTGVNAQEIPLDDKDTMSIFTSSKILGYENDPILSKVGSVGIPEFGTGFTRGMLMDTMPTQFDTLIRLSGFSHGTDVWLGNAKDLILSGTATVGQAIGCRDDIMLYLIKCGMPEKRAFKIMESVRKGRGLPSGAEEEMIAAGVPAWYIGSCKKIQYLFPKAHAAAYVMMAFRIAWFKVHHPLAYYAAYFYRRSQKDSFDAVMMTHGIDTVKAHIKAISSNPDHTAKDDDLLTTLEVCYEFYLRGFDFASMDLYESDAIKFVIKDGKLLPPFVAVSGLGDTAAKDIVAGREGKHFISIEEFAAACPKVSKTHIENLKAAGAFGDLPDTSQITLF